MRDMHEYQARVGGKEGSKFCGNICLGNERCGVELLPVCCTIGPGAPVLMADEPFC